MGLYTLLLSVAATITTLYNTLYNFANASESLPFVGSTLKSWINIVALAVLQFSGKIIDLAYGWINVYNDLRNSFTLPVILTTLSNYAWDLIGFINNPVLWVRTWIRTSFPTIDNVLINPVSFVLSVINTYIHIPQELQSDPSGYIRTLIENILGELATIRNDPVGYIRNVVIRLFPIVMTITGDAGSWIISHIQSRFPLLIQFAQNPDGFILERITVAFDRLLETNKSKLLKLAENILQEIF